ncbi:hypothetical protein ASG06_17200 [Rathayibacter sp. Leaf185]|nr:hypothetical protein ASF42_17200 [Rathayibacter sp. Leaf294]KQS09566.1 hypothetical protein ASG06_17200 [Rathayibacter sp. Leaf185]
MLCRPSARCETVDPLALFDSKEWLSGSTISAFPECVCGTGGSMRFERWFDDGSRSPTPAPA